VPGISGTTLAPKQARFNVARFGATRFGYYWPNLIVKVNGTNRASEVRLETLEIETALKQPARATLTVREGVDATTIAAADNTLIVALGADQDGLRLFDGEITEVGQDQEQSARTVEYEVTGLGELAAWDRAFVMGEYTGQTITAIAEDLVDQINTQLGTSYTTVGVQVGLATIDAFIVTNVRPSTAFSRLVAYLTNGRWYVQDGDLHLLTTESSVTMPSDLTSSNVGFWDLHVRTARQQIRTQIIVEGRKTICPISVPVTAANASPATGLPLEDAGQIDAGPGYVRMGTQVLAYDTASGPDLSDGANAPGTNVASDVAVGATTVPVDSIAAMSVGWVKIGDQVIVFHNLILTALDEVPASGFGSITAPIKAGTPVTQLGSLSLASTQAIAAAIPKDTDVVQRAVVDDATAQGTQGIRSVLIQDGTLSYDGAVARANAELANFKAPVKIITYKTRDPRTKVGRTITASLSAPTSLTGTFTIRTVRAYGFDQRGPLNAHHRTSFPILDVTAAPVGFLDAIDVLTIGEDAS
jgi:hypothetical protein